jgi:cysteine synthase A
MFLKSKNPKVKAFLADPEGSVLYHWYENGKLERTEGSSITEGIGQGRVTENLKGAKIDGALFIRDKEIVESTFNLLYEEGFFVVASSGLNVVAAMEVDKMLGPGHTIVTCLCDTGNKYVNRLYSKEELTKRNLLDAVPEKYRKFLKD